MKAGREVQSRDDMFSIYFRTCDNVAKPPQIILASVLKIRTDATAAEEWVVIMPAA